MADKAETIRLTGMKEFRKELAKLDDKTFTKELKHAHWLVGTVVIVNATHLAKFPVQLKASDSLKASKSGTSAQISYGGPNYPYAMGAEFGSNRYTQFPPHLGRTGYFLYPAIRESHDEVMGIYEDAVGEITRKAFPN